VGRVSMRMDTLMKQRLRSSRHCTPRDASWLTDVERSREIRGLLMERLLLHEALSADTLKDARFWELRNRHGTRRRAGGRDADGRGAPDGTHVPPGEAAWRRCRERAEFAYGLLRREASAIGLRAEGAEKAEGGEEDKTADTGKLDTGEESTSTSTVMATATVVSLRDAPHPDPDWDFLDHHVYATRMLRRLGAESETSGIIERRRETARAAVHFAAAPATEGGLALRLVERGAVEATEAWAQGLRDAQLGEMLSGTGAAGRAGRAGEGARDLQGGRGDGLPAGWAAFADIGPATPTDSAVHGLIAPPDPAALARELLALRAGAQAAAEVEARAAGDEARRLLREARVMDSEVAGVEVPGPALRTAHSVCPTSRAVWWRYDFGMGAAPDETAAAHLGDAVRARAWWRHRLFPSVFTVDRLARELRVRPQRALAVLMRCHREAEAGLFGVPLDEMARENALAEDAQLGLAPTADGGGERHVVRLRTFPWTGAKDATRAEWEAACVEAAAREERAMAAEMLERARWNLGVVGRGLARGPLAAARESMRARRVAAAAGGDGSDAGLAGAAARGVGKGRAGGSWPLLVTLTDRHLRPRRSRRRAAVPADRGDDPADAAASADVLGGRAPALDRCLDETSWVSEVDGTTRPLTPAERVLLRRQTSRPRPSFFRARVPGRDGWGPREATWARERAPRT